MTNIISEICIDAQEQSEILNIVNNFVKNRFNYKKDLITNCEHGRPGNHFRLDGRCAKFILFLRFGYCYFGRDNKTLVIAKIEFKEQRKGHGTALLKLLYKIARQYDYKYITVESTNENSAAFAKHFGFIRRTTNDNLLGSNNIDNYYYIETKNLVI